MGAFPTWHQIFDNHDTAAAVLFGLAAMLGQVMHGIKKGLDGDNGMTCVQWFRIGARRTLSAMLGNFMGYIIVLQSGILTAIYEANNGWWALLLFGVMNGFSADSAINKATKKIEDQDKTNPGGPSA